MIRKILFLMLGVLPILWASAELRHETLEEPGRFRLHALSDRGALVAVFGAADHEPTVRKDGEFYTITLLIPSAGPAAAVPWPLEGGEVEMQVPGAMTVLSRFNEAARAYVVQIKTPIAPTVSKRGALWIFISTPGLR